MDRKRTVTGRVPVTCLSGAALVTARLLAMTLALAVAIMAVRADAQTQPIATQVDEDPSVLSATAARVRELIASGNARSARGEMRELAQNGDADAQDALAAMWLEGIGGAADREVAMSWFCRLAHQPRGGRAVMRALWFLAEYFRTGGGLPGRRYLDGTRELQNPVKAYFWYQLMVKQAELYDVTLDEALKLGRLGSASVGRELLAGEKQQVDRRIQRWSPRDPVVSARTCLKLPQS